MIGLLAAPLVARGFAAPVARALAIGLLVLAAVLLVVGAVRHVRRGGEAAGAARVEQQQERAHAARAAEARGDERAAQAAAAAVADDVAAIQAATDARLHQSIEDLNDALRHLPAADRGGLPAAPVDRLRDNLNAGIARANRAADAAAAAD